MSQREAVTQSLTDSWKSFTVFLLVVAIQLIKLGISFQLENSHV